jgi:hypothetical protein
MKPIQIARMVQNLGSGSYGGGSSDTQTVTSGASGSAVNGDRVRGFVTGSLGSIADGTSNLYSGAAIRELASVENTDFDVVLQITGVLANSGWTSMNVGGTHVLLRADAGFSTAGGNSTWTWTAAGQLFGSSGTVTVVGFS